MDKEPKAKTEESTESQAVDSGKDKEPVNEKPDKKTADEKSGENSGLWIELDIEASSEDVSRRIDAQAEQYAAKARIPGFRQGKVPADVVKKRYRKLITDEALTEVIESFVSDRIRNDKLQVVSRPELKDVQYEDGGDLKASIRVEVMPEVTLPDLDAFTVTIPAEELKIKPFVQDEQIDHFLEHNRRRVAVKDRPVAEGDTVVLKHQVMNLDNRRMSPRKSLHIHVGEEGSGGIPDIDKELIGRNSGDELIFRRKYPEDHPRNAWAGKEMEHHAVIEAVHTQVKPELTEEFLKSIGFDSKEKFLERMKEEYESQSDKARQDRIMSAIAEQLSDAADFPVPDTLVHQEIMQAVKQNPGLMYAPDESGKEQRIAELEAMAARNIRFSLLLEAVKTEFKIKADAEELEKKLKEMSESAGVPLKEVRKYYAPAERRNQLMDSLERDKALEILREKVKIKEV